MCPPMWHIGTTWWMWLNLCFLQSIQVHNTNGKSIGSAFLCTAHGRVSSGTLPPGKYNWNSAPWRYLENTFELVLLLAHPNLQPKRQIDWLSRFCTTHGRKSLYFTTGDPFPKNCPFSWGYVPCLIHGSLGQFEPTIQAGSRSVQTFAYRWPQSIPTLYKIAHSHKRIWTPI